MWHDHNDHHYHGHHHHHVANLARHLMVTLLPFLTTTRPSAGSLTTWTMTSPSRSLLSCCKICNADRFDDVDDKVGGEVDNHPGWQEDVQLVRDRDGQVAVGLDLTIVLTTVVHLLRSFFHPWSEFPFQPKLSREIIATSSWLITRLLFMNIILIIIIIRRSECHLKLADDQIVAVQLQTLVPPHHHVASGEHSWALVMIMMIMVMMVTVVKRRRRKKMLCGVNGTCDDAKIAPPASTSAPLAWPWPWAWAWWCCWWWWGGCQNPPAYTWAPLAPWWLICWWWWCDGDDVRWQWRWWWWWWWWCQDLLHLLPHEHHASELFHSALKLHLHNIYHCHNIYYHHNFLTTTTLIRISLTFCVLKKTQERFFVPILCTLPKIVFPLYLLKITQRVKMANKRSNGMDGSWYGSGPHLAPLFH